MTREEAIKILMGYSHTPQERAAMEVLIPELAESEDERIRKSLVALIKEIKLQPLKRLEDWDGMLTWLEKQKENPKSADSIPSDCVSDVKCENRWFKVGDFLPDNGRDVLAKDALGNYLIAHYDGDQWFISGYDNEDKPIVYTPAIKEWCDIPPEKQKEQQPILKFKVGDKIHLIDGTSPNYEDDCITIREIGTVNYIGEFKEGYVPIKEQNKCELVKEQKPQWTEEDERILKGIIGLIDHNQHYGVSNKEMLDWLKSLRPSWKPSEEQIRALERAIVRFNTVGDIPILTELRDKLKKL